MVETTQVQHFQIGRLTSQTTRSLDDEGGSSSSSVAEDSYNAPLSQEAEAENTSLLNGHWESNHSTEKSDNGGSSVVRTSLNIAKLCMGTGTLALP